MLLWHLPIWRDFLWHPFRCGVVARPPTARRTQELLKQVRWDAKPRKTLCLPLIIKHEVYFRIARVSPKNGAPPKSLPEARPSPPPPPSPELRSPSAPVHRARTSGGPARGCGGRGSGAQAPSLEFPASARDDDAPAGRTIEREGREHSPRRWEEPGGGRGALSGVGEEPRGAGRRRRFARPPGMGGGFPPRRGGGAAAAPLPFPGLRGFRVERPRSRSRGKAAEGHGAPPIKIGWFRNRLCAPLAPARVLEESMGCILRQVSPEPFRCWGLDCSLATRSPRVPLENKLALVSRT